MRIDPFPGQPHRHRAWREGLLLLATTPVLLFPERYPLLTAASLLALAGAWLWPLPGRRGPAWPETPLNGAMLLWSVTLAIGILVTADPDLTLPKATGLVLGVAAWRWLAWARPAPAWGVAGFLMLSLGFLLVGAAATDWLAKVPALSRWLPPQILLLPGRGALGVQANQLAGTVLIFLPLMATLALDSAAGPAWQRWLLGAGAVLSGGILLLTQSRAGWLGAAGGALALPFFYGWRLPPGRQRRRLRRLAWVTVMAVLVGLVAAGPTLVSLWNHPWQETVVGGFGSLAFRREVWRWGTTAVADFPLTGTGLGAFRRVALRLYPLLVPAGYDIAHAHNVWLQVALDQGLGGVIGYTAVLGVTAWTAWQAATTARARPLALGLLAGLVALHVFGVADALAPGAKPGLLFWWALGLLSATYGARPGHDRLQEPT